MIQVYLQHDCPHCGQPMVASREVLSETRNIPQYKDTYDDSVFFYVDPIRDNAEAALIVELCRKHNLNYHVWDEDEIALQDDTWKEFVQEFIPPDKVELAWLDFLAACLRRLT